VTKVSFRAKPSAGSRSKEGTATKVSFRAKPKVESRNLWGWSSETRTREPPPRFLVENDHSRVLAQTPRQVHDSRVPRFRMHRGDSGNRVRPSRGIAGLETVGKDPQEELIRPDITLIGAARIAILWAW